ncbi:MAG: hypothetical protein GY830_03495 [Bacteroidetes bacterium]|nr:hypothetical protein [Bacteroidota bacterium]
MNLKLKSLIIICIITISSCSTKVENYIKKNSSKSHKLLESKIYKKKCFNFYCKKGYVLPTMISFFLFSSYMLFPDKSSLEIKKFNYNLNFIEGNKDDCQNDNDWFTEKNWDIYLNQINYEDNELGDNLLLNNLQRVDNICKYKNNFKVFDELDIFQFDNVSPIDLFGNEGDDTYRENNRIIYQKIFKSTVWKKDEFLKANCIKDKTNNHLIILSKYPQMIGEWYVRTILPLYNLKSNEIINSTDIKIYLMNWLNNPLFNSHHLFIEPFTKYPLLSLRDLLLNKLECVCFDRILFLGFKKENHIWFPEDDILFFKSSEYTNRMNNEIIKFYKNSFNKIDPNLNKDSFFFKKRLIENHLNKQIKMKEVYKWKLIGLYDRKFRRKWLNINEICNAINDYKYYLCYKIILETEIENLYSRDILKIHSA